MKTTVKFIQIILGVAFLILQFSSCNRDKEEVAAELSSSELNAASVTSADEDNTSSNIDNALDDANNELSSLLSGGRVEEAFACGYSVDRTRFSTITGSNKTIVIEYDGKSTCNARSRKGKVTITLAKGDNFADKDAEYTAVFEGFGTTYRGETMTINGTQTVVNVSGGLPRFTITRPNQYPSVKHKVTGTMKVTFGDDASERNWNVYRILEWTNKSGVVGYSISSDQSADGYSNVVASGTNRLGNKFYTQLTQAITGNSACGRFRPATGQRIHTVLDAEGNVLVTMNHTITTGADGCGAGYTIEAKNKNGKSRNINVTYNY